jgi:hypothetical protein
MNINALETRDLPMLTDNEIKALVTRLLTSNIRRDLLGAVMAEEETRNSDALLSFGFDDDQDL